MGGKSENVQMSQLRSGPDKDSRLDFPVVPELANSIDTVLMQSNRSKPLLTLVNFGRLYLLYSVIFCQVAIFLTEMIMNQFVHSLLLLADAYHHLFNALNCGLLVVSLKISRQVTIKNTFGWIRTEIIGMLITITFIFSLSFSLCIEGFLQLSHLHEINKPTNNWILFIFGLWSLGVNVIYVLTINGKITRKKYKQTSRVERSFSTANCASVKQKLPCQLIDEVMIIERIDEPRFEQKRPSTVIEQVAEDPSIRLFLGSLFQGLLTPCLLLCCHLFISYYGRTEWGNMIDPLLGVLGTLVLAATFIKQFLDTTFILMQTVPENININQLKKDLLTAFPKILAIHELHIWGLNNADIVATCHLVLAPSSTRDYQRLFDRVKSFLHLNYNIVFITVQPEFYDDDPADLDEDLCLMKCKSEECEKMTCCSAMTEEEVEKSKKKRKKHKYGISHDHGHGHGHSH